MKDARIHGEWLEHDGKVVTIGGLKYRIRVKTWQVIYPYEYEAIIVEAEPVSKRSKHYRAMRRDLGDDWSTDVLGSTLRLECDVLEQCRAQ